MLAPLNSHSAARVTVFFLSEIRFSSLTLAASHPIDYREILAFIKLLKVFNENT